MKAQSPNHWTTREFPFLISCLVSSCSPGPSAQTSADSSVFGYSLLSYCWLPIHGGLIPHVQAASWGLASKRWTTQNHSGGSLLIHSSLANSAAAKSPNRAISLNMALQHGLRILGEINRTPWAGGCVKPCARGRDTRRGEKCRPLMKSANHRWKANKGDIDWAFLGKKQKLCEHQLYGEFDSIWAENKVTKWQLWSRCHEASKSLATQMWVEKGVWII